MNIVIFTGPTISINEAKQHLDAVYLPPAKQGDIVSAIFKYEPDVIGLIDGESYPELEVWHREILYAIENGITVYGASAIGALRAVELEIHGMIGIGEIYKYLKDLAISDDDDVMCDYDKTGEYARLSEPFVNMRATLQAARRENILGDREYDDLIKAAKSIYYKKRSFGGLFENISKNNLLSRERLARLEIFAKDRYVDQQKRDALHLLDAVKSAPVPDAVKKMARIVDESDSLVFHVLKYRDRDIERDNVNAPYFSLADYIILNHPEADELCMRAKNRFLVQILADIFHVTPSDEEISDQERIFRARYNLLDDGDFKKWLERNDLIHQEFRRLMVSNAKIHSLHKWLRTRLGQRKFTRIILDELMLTDKYSSLMDKACLAEKISRENETVFKDLYQNESLEKLTRDHIKDSWKDWHRIFSQTMTDVELSGFPLKHQLIKTRIEREAIEKKFRQILSSAGQIDER